MMFNYRFKKPFILRGLIVCVLIGVFGVFVHGSAQDFGLNEAMNIGGGALGTADISDVIVNIVNIALGFLGIVAVIIIMYGGWLWMTAAGNLEKIDKAKRVLIGAVIGLAIIIASWAITSFLIRAFSTATGGPFCTLGDTRVCGCCPPGCGLEDCTAAGIWSGVCVPTAACTAPVSFFDVVSKYPADGAIDVTICTAVFAEFSKDVDPATVTGSTFFVTRAGVPVSGTLTVTGRFVEFVADSDLLPSESYQVDIYSDAIVHPPPGSLQSVDGDFLTGGDVSWTFDTGTEEDTAPPFVVVPTVPYDNEVDVCLATYLEADFNEPMLPSSLTTGKISVRSPAPAIPLYNARAVTKFLPSMHHSILAQFYGLLDQNESYDVTVEATVKDACGNMMDYDGDGIFGEVPDDNFGGTPPDPAPYWRFDTGTTPQCTPKIDLIAGSGYYDRAFGNWVVIQGKYFGAYNPPPAGQSEITFNNQVQSFATDQCLNNANFLADAACFMGWNPSVAATYLPAGGGNTNGAVSGPVTLRNDSGSVSNSVNYSVVAPHIYSINSGRTYNVSGTDYPSGGVDQLVSVWGENFGTNGNPLDSVIFRSVANPAVVYPANLPCTTAPFGGWTDKEIIISVPNTMSGEIVGSLWYVQVIKDVGNIARYSTLATFAYDGTAPGPGLCDMNPKLGPVGTTIASIDGIRFEVLDATRRVEFGNLSSSVEADGFLVWIDAGFNDIVNGAVVPNILPSAGIGVFLKDDTGLASNSLLFDVLATGDVPIILDFSPASGGEGQYVTITGRNFGYNEGSVYLNNTGGASAGDVINIYIPLAFPPQCQGGLWRDDQIIVKIPDYVGLFVQGSYTIVVERDDGARGNSSGLITPLFTANLASPTPGICLVEPSNGIATTPVSIYGDNYGLVIDTVEFFNSVNVTVLSSWANQQIDTEVPVGAETGPLHVVVGGIYSNPYLFSVGLCTPGTCAPGSTCCETGQFAGQCRIDPFPGIDVCKPWTLACLQSWTFDTGVGPGTPCDGDPAIPACQPDDTLCASNNYVCDIASGCTCQMFGVAFNQGCGSYNQSPSPWPDTDNACVNSIVNVRFNSAINTASVIYGAGGNVRLEECSEPTCASAPFTLVPISSLTPINNVLPPFDGFEIIPAVNLTQDVSYKVTISSGPLGVMSASGVPMGVDFEWKFKVRNDPLPCTPDMCLMTPSQDKVTIIGDFKPYNLDSLRLNCNIISDIYPYDLNADPAVAMLEQFGVPIASVPTTPAAFDARAVGQGATDIKAVYQPNNSLTCQAKFIVDSKIPSVIDKWPYCSNACTNVSIGARFSVPVAEANLNFSVPALPTDTVRLYETTLPLTQLTISSLNFDTIGPPGQPAGYTATVDFNSGSPLALGTTYQVQFQADQIFSESLESLEPNQGSLYVWEFTTKSTGNGLCEVDHIFLEPETITVRAVGVTQDFVGQAYGPPDECNPTSGQRLVNTSYSWTDGVGPEFGWRACDSAVCPDPAPEVADIVRPLLDMPPPGLVDPVQKAATVGVDASCGAGSCISEIQGSIDPGIGGELPFRCDAGGLNKCATLTLVCGYQVDSQCSDLPPAGIGLGPGYGVGYNSCCGLRPQYLPGDPDSYPQDGDTGVCRNGIFSTAFDIALDPASIPGNVFLAKNVKSSICPIGTASLLVKGDDSAKMAKTLPSGNIFKRFVFWIKQGWQRLFTKNADAAYVSGDNLCIVPSSIYLSGGDPRKVEITPHILLDDTSGLPTSPDPSEYVIVILGDDDYTDGNKVGIRSAQGVTFIGSTTLIRGGLAYNSEIISFNTKPDICKIDHIDHGFGQGPLLGPGVPFGQFLKNLFRKEMVHRFFCVRDDCPDDMAPSIIFPAAAGFDDSGNQHFLLALAEDKENHLLVANWSYIESGPDFYNRLDPVTGPGVGMPGFNMIVVDDDFPGYSTDVRGNLTVIAENPFDLSNKIGKTLGIHLFVCENPWPSIDDFPFQDLSAYPYTSCDEPLSNCPYTNFEFYYCRDAGGPGTQDDLPALGVDPVVVGTPGEKICYGGEKPGEDCSLDPTICDCPPGSTICTRDGFCSSASLKDLVFIREGPPSAPHSLSSQGGVPLTGGIAPLTWLPPLVGPAPSGYKLYWGLQADNLIYSMDVGNTTQATISNLDKTRVYYFAVTSYVRHPFGGAESGFSPQPPGAFQPIDTVAPSNAMWALAVVWYTGAVSNSPGQVSLGWNPHPEADVVGYRLSIGTSSGNYQEVRDVGNITDYSLSLGSGATYYFALQAYDDSGNLSGLTTETSVTVL